MLVHFVEGEPRSEFKPGQCTTHVCQCEPHASPTGVLFGFLIPSCCQVWGGVLLRRVLTQEREGSVLLEDGRAPDGPFAHKDFCYVNKGVTR